jgi:hypothetical protein
MEGSMRSRQVAPVETDQDRGVLRELRRLDGRATVGDVMTRTGLVQSEAEASLRRLLESRRGHLEVGESGTLVYRFEEGFMKRDDEPFWSRFKRRAWEVFKTGFKVWTLVMLVVYLVVFVALLLAAIFAGKKGDSDWGGGGGGGRRHGGGHSHFPNFLFWYWLWSPGWGWGRPYYGHRWEERVGAREARVPLYKKVFAFVFGPDRPRPTQAQKDRSILRLIRSRRGVVTAADVVQHTGLRRHEAEEELARLIAAYDGDVKVGDNGTLVYVFPELMVSAHGRVAEKTPDPAWRRLERPLEVTGNSNATNFAVGAVNAFNLAAAATAPLFIFPRLGLGGPGAWVFLVWVPLVFSTMFFGIPLLRRFGVWRENREREERNLRKLLLSHVYRASLVGDGAQPITAGGAAASAAKLSQQQIATPRVEAEMTRLSADWDATVSPSPDGDIEYRFDAIRGEFQAAEVVRNELALEKREVGDIVYSSADTSSEESARAAKAFDRELARAERPAMTGGRGGDLSGYLPPADRAAFIDDFEMVAFEEEMKRRSPARRTA